jgi:FhuF 2Fe-2S C-terminal domain/Ferric iron reductase FhuF-like transporter
MLRMPGAPLAETLRPLFDLGVDTRLEAHEGDGWVAAGRLVEEGDELRAALAQIAENLGTDRDDVCAAQLIELWTWLVAAPAAAGLVAGARLPDVSSGNVLLRARGGLADWRVGLRRPRFHALPGDPEARHPDALPAADERELLRRLGTMLVHAHLAPLVTTLNRSARRPERALWRGAADRVAGAFLWIGEQLGARERSRALARGAVGSAPELRAKVRIQRVRNGAEETHVHLRHGCCLYYRVPGAPKCIGCPLVTDAERIRRVAADRSA